MAAAAAAAAAVVGRAADGGRGGESGLEAAGEAALCAAGLSMDALKQLLRREEELRTSDATQAAYAAAEADGSQTDWLCVTDELQRRLLEEAAVPAERCAAALHVLRAASQLWPRDPELAGPEAIALYVRHQRAARGTLISGAAAPPVPLFTLGGEPTSLAAACGDKPTLLVAGSWS